MKIKYNIVYNKCNDVAFDILNINKTNLKEIKEKQNVNFNLDFNNINKKHIKKIVKVIEKINRKHKTNLNYNLFISMYNKNDQNHKAFIKSIEASCIKDIEDRYNFIYDEVCEFLDNEFITKDICKFKNNKCGEKIKTSSEVGCCRHYKNKFMGPLAPKNPLIVCEYLKNKKCSAKCISCKLYTCDYLRNKGIQFKIKNILLLDIFFNPIQKYIIKYSVFTPKEEIIKRLMFLKKR